MGIEIKLNRIAPIVAPGELGRYEFGYESMKFWRSLLFWTALISAWIVSSFYKIKITKGNVIVGEIRLYNVYRWPIEAKAFILEHLVFSIIMGFVVFLILHVLIRRKRKNS